MPYPMVHLCIAYDIMNHTEPMEHPEDFLLGCIAPDSVHFRNDYAASMKEASHVWNCGPQWGITLDSPGWYRNIADFRTGIHIPEYSDFLSGYCVHLFTDWIHDTQIWRSIRHESERLDDPDIILHYRQEAINYDEYLSLTYADSPQIFGMLEQGNGCFIPGIVQMEDLAKIRHHLTNVQYQNCEEHDITRHRYCRADNMTAFMDYCIDHIPEMLIL